MEFAAFIMQYAHLWPHNQAAFHFMYHLGASVILYLMPKGWVAESSHDFAACRGISILESPFAALHCSFTTLFPDGHYIK